MTDHAATAFAALRRARTECNFITSSDVSLFCKVGSPFTDLSVIVRCGTHRFVCAVRDVQAQIEGVEAADDYVRDVSIHPDATFPRDPYNPEEMTLPELREVLGAMDEGAAGRPDAHYEDYITDLIAAKIEREDHA